MEALGMAFDNRSVTLAYILCSHKYCCQKTYRVLGLISKSFECKDPNVIVRLYTTLMPPIIKYNNVLWGPAYILNNQKLE